MTALASDAFTRADGGLGANWTTLATYDAPVIVSNRVQDATNTGSESAAFYNAITWPNDQYSQMTVVSSDANSSFGIWNRCSLPGAIRQGYYLIMDTGSGSTYTYYRGKCVAGTFTDYASVTVTVNANSLLRIEAQGTSIRAYVDGGQVSTTQTDSAITAGSPGFEVGAFSPSATSTCPMDNFEGGDFFPPFRRRILRLTAAR